MDDSPFEPGACLDWSHVQSIATLEVSRAFRFRPELRDVLAGYLGIGADSLVAEVGCGTGILTNYLAEGMPRGLILGIDVTSEFIAFAKAQRRNLPNVDFLRGDAYTLPLGSGVLDACTSYTLLAILRDPGAALREQTRVTRKGGVVSAIEVVRADIAYEGRPHSSLPADEQDRLLSLRREWNRISAECVDPQERKDRGYGWTGRVEELPLLLESAGLKEIRLRGFFSTFSTSDETYGREERRWFLRQIGENELAWIDHRWTHWRETYVKEGFSDADQRELRRLILGEQALRLRDFAGGHHAWAWHGTANLVIAGTV